MDFVLLVGRIMYGWFFVMNGFLHFKMLKGYSAYAASKGVPMPKLGVIVSGLMILLGGLGIIFNYRTEWALYLVIAFLIPVTFMMHNFWAQADPNQKMIEQVNFFKNLGLLGAAIMILGLII